MQSEQIQITAGPSNKDMSEALIEAPTGEGKNLIAFSLEGFTEPVNFILLGMTAEDGSRQCWCLSMLLAAEVGSLNHGRYDAFYRSNDGTGYLTRV